MKNQETNDQREYSVDVMYIIKLLWRRAWVIALCGLMLAAVGFSIATFAVPPKYSSSVKLYVNNTSISLGSASFSISPSELTAAQSLIQTYGEILKSRSTLQRISDKSGLDYSWKELSGMIEYTPSNKTEIMKVTVTCKNPYHASTIANTVAEILPIRIAEIIDGASMEVVDSAIPNLGKVSPSVTLYTAVGLIIGIVIPVGVIVLFAMLDDTIHDEDYILNAYDYPILGKIPDLLYSGGKSYGYYYQKHKKSDTSGKESK